MPAEIGVPARVVGESKVWFMVAQPRVRQALRANDVGRPALEQGDRHFLRRPGRLHVPIRPLPHPTRPSLSRQGPASNLLRIKISSRFV
jgi:hypothetical protein